MLNLLLPKHQTAESLPLHLKYTYYPTFLEIQIQIPKIQSLSLFSTLCCAEWLSCV